MGQCVGGVGFNGRPVLPFRRLPVVGEIGRVETESGPHLGHLGRQGGSAFHRRARLGPGRRRLHSVKGEAVVCGHKAGVGKCVGRVLFNRLFEELRGLLQRTHLTLVPVVLSLEVELIRVRGGCRSLQLPLGFRTELHLERLDDVLRDLVLKGEDVLHPPVVALGPELVAVVDVDQLDGDPDAFPGRAD